LTATRTRPGPSLRRRADNLILRWQGRLDAAWADRVVPWALAGVLAIVYFGLALARQRSLDDGADLASWTQAAWLVGHFRDAQLTIPGTHVLALQTAFGFYPLGWATRLLPAIPTLLAAQSTALALAVVPIWKITRKLAGLRVGAAAALVVAYAFSPAVNQLNLADFHPVTLALPVLIAATYFALQKRWLLYGIAAALAVACRADLGIVVAGIGLLLIVNGERRAGIASVLAGGTWTAVAVLVVQPHFGATALVSPGAFEDYGHSFFGVAGGMLAHPFRVTTDLFARENLDLVIVLFGPLLFLPLLAPRYLLPAVPLQVLYLVADVPHSGRAGAQYTVPLVAFLFVAAAFALQRLGRRSLERVTVDRRILIALVVASLAFFARFSPNSPYDHPWDWGHRDLADRARLDAVDQVPDEAAVRASPSVLPLLAERETVYALTTGVPVPATATEGVSAVVMDTRTLHDWTDEEALAFASEMRFRGFLAVYQAQGITVFREVASG
jgi:uncharacterized membrane protein